MQGGWSLCQREAGTAWSGHQAHSKVQVLWIFQKPVSSIADSQTAASKSQYFRQILITEGWKYFCITVSQEVGQILQKLLYTRICSKWFVFLLTKKERKRRKQLLLYFVLSVALWNAAFLLQNSLLLPFFLPLILPVRFGSMFLCNNIIR